ncbi:MAG: hypothetical protein ACFFF9_13665 [Candidatus Thorarchaeota archaeon]
MSKAKWIMKQYWRIGTIRALASLGLGMLVLGRYYFGYVPVLADLGWIGALSLGVILIFVFLGVGWWYDQKARMWSQMMQASAERNPFYYVPNYKSLTMEYPIFYTLIQVMKDVANSIGHDIQRMSDLIHFMDEFFQSKPDKRDIRAMEKAAQKYMENNPFKEFEVQIQTKIPIRSRVKLAFETQKLRLTWIQNLTGLVQDVLVFGALYVVILFPAASLEYQLFFAIFGISLPMLIVLTILGWYYDKRLKIWSVDEAVKIERYPYSYVAEPYLYSRIYPFLFVFFKTMRDILKTKSKSLEEIDEALIYLGRFWNLDVSRTQDLTEAQQLRKAYGVLFQKDKRS